MPIESLRPYSDNPRNGDTEAIKESLKANSQYRPIVVRKGTNEILAGNHTYAAAMELGWREIAATFVECSDEQAARIVLVDNRTNDLAKYDDGLLIQQIEKLNGSLTGTGWDQNAVDELREKVAKSLAESIGLGNPVIQYNIVFDDEQQQESWYAFVRYLKMTYPDAGSLGERLKAFLSAYFTALEQQRTG